MFKRILQLAVFTAIIAPAFHASADTIRISETAGLVLVNSGDAFQTARPGQLLKQGDQLYVLDNSVVVLAEENGCHLKVRHNALMTLKSSLCQVKAEDVKFTGTQYAAAIGLIVEEPVSDVATQKNSSAIGTIVVEEEPLKITQEDTQVASAPEDETENLAAKLAVPATVLGAIGFSTLAGGGGILGDDSSDEGNGDSPETDPVSPS